jgi:hypothetical protein
MTTPQAVLEEAPPARKAKEAGPGRDRRRVGGPPVTRSPSCSVCVESRSRRTDCRRAHAFGPSLVKGR